MSHDTEQAGLQCPRCGCRHLEVQYTERGNRCRVRIRVCRHCGTRVRTREQITGTCPKKPCR